MAMVCALTRLDMKTRILDSTRCQQINVSLAGDDIGDGTRLYRGAGERYRPSGSTPSYWLIVRTGRRYDQLVTGREFSEVLVSGVPRRHIGTPATCILGQTQPNPQTVEKRQQQQLP